jgi:hypothetical protein
MNIVVCYAAFLELASDDVLIAKQLRCSGA